MHPQGGNMSGRERERERGAIFFLGETAVVDAPPSSFIPSPSHASYSRRCSSLSIHDALGYLPIDRDAHGILARGCILCV